MKLRAPAFPVNHQSSHMMTKKVPYHGNDSHTSNVTHTMLTSNDRRRQNSTYLQRLSRAPTWGKIESPMNLLSHGIALHGVQHYPTFEKFHIHATPLRFNPGSSSSPHTCRLVCTNPAKYSAQSQELPQLYSHPPCNRRGAICSLQFALISQVSLDGMYPSTRNWTKMPRSSMRGMTRWDVMDQNDGEMRPLTCTMFLQHMASTKTFHSDRQPLRICVGT